MGVMKVVKHLDNMENKAEDTFWAKIYLSGDLAVIKQACREYCMMGLCVTIKEVLFIYTGGEEYGVEIGLINYPRFPDTKENIYAKTIKLAEICRDRTFQWSYLVMTPETTFYNSIRPIKNQNNEPTRPTT